VRWVTVVDRYDVVAGIVVVKEVVVVLNTMAVDTEETVNRSVTVDETTLVVVVVAKDVAVLEVYFH
jgi:hypothetical protein